MSVRYEKTSFGVGTLVRFKDRKSYAWTHAIYRGTEKNAKGRVYAYIFSDYPLGPITRWLGYWPEHMEAAVTAPSDTSTRQGGE